MVASNTRCRFELFADNPVVGVLLGNGLAHDPLGRPVGDGHGIEVRSVRLVRDGASTPKVPQDGFARAVRQVMGEVEKGVNGSQRWRCYRGAGLRHRQSPRSAGRGKARALPYGRNLRCSPATSFPRCVDLPCARLHRSTNTPISGAALWLGPNRHGVPTLGVSSLDLGCTARPRGPFSLAIMTACWRRAAPAPRSRSQVQAMLPPCFCNAK